VQCEITFPQAVEKKKNKREKKDDKKIRKEEKTNDQAEGEEPN
jgi:hypothetical protein